MRRMKTVISLALVLVLALAFTGCGKMTSEKLVMKMVKATEGKMITQATAAMEIEMDMTVGQAGITMDVGMDIDYLMDMKLQADPEVFYGEISMNMAMEMLGETMEEKTNSKTYVEMVDGKPVAYVYNETTGTWETGEVDMADSLEDMAREMDYSFLKELISAVTMDEETQTLNGKEVYVLRVTITGEQMKESMGGVADVGSLLGESGADAEVDLSAISIPLVIYVDAETSLPVKMEMEIMGMDEMIKPMLGEKLGDLQGMDVNLTVPKCMIIYENIGFDPVDIPAIAKN